MFFFTLVCGEFLSKTEIHPVQYIIASGAPVLFHMLPAVILAAVFAFSCAVNFVILQMEDFALFSGTAILAMSLGMLMVFTGKINRRTGE